MPEIFLLPSATEGDDDFFAVAGRALALGARFEGLCRTLNVLLQLRSTKEPILQSEESFGAFVNELWDRNLHRQVGGLTAQLNEAKDLFSILEEARKARNLIAHELTMSFESWNVYPEARKHFLDTLRPAVQALAEADWWLSIVTTVATNEERPAGSFLLGYRAMLVSWVLGESEQGA